MKTAALAKHTTSGPEAAKGGGPLRKPFFSAPVQTKAEEMQARLRLGRPGDRFELEADRVADVVVDGKSARAGQRGVAASITPLTQRKEEVQARVEEEPEVQARTEKEEEVQAQTEEEEAQAKANEEELQPKGEQEEEVQAQAEEEEAQAKSQEEEENVQAEADKEEEVQAQAENEEEAQAKAEEEEALAKKEEEELQARSAKGGGLTVDDDVARQVRASRGRGNPLTGPVRAKMEAQFAADFSGVRIHTDAPAVLLAKALKAQAFTRGNDIFFNEGKFAPGSRDGEHLLAHELTHTVQQGAVEPQQSPGNADMVRLAPAADADSYEVRPEIVEAIRLARGEIGKVNAKKADGDGKRVGWERLREYFETAFGGPVVSEQVIDRIVMIEKTDPNGAKKRMDALPSWCGIFTWWAMKKAGIPIPDWKLGAPALDAMKPRAGGELPRKGDIAIDVLPNNHFAMVTGLESAKDAEGKPQKLVRVATVNGNTAGDDNLGGQVQERWDTLSRWDHFLDPVGKMKLPEVPLVTVSREPTAIEAAPEAAPTAEAEKPPVEEGPRPEVTDLETGLAAPEPDAFGAPLPEPDLSLPPPADTGPAEAVAVVEKADLTGTSDEATTNFIDASPSAMAATQPDFGPVVDGKMKSEQTDLAENPPVLEAKTSGAVEAPIAGPDQIPVPGDTQLGDGVTGADPGAIDKVALASPQPFRGNAAREEELDKEDSGSFWDAFKNFLKRFVTGIRTRDDSIDTSAGERPNVALKAEADPTRMKTQREEGTTALKARRDTQTEAFRNHPGQANIQPRKIDEQRPAPISAEPTAEIEPQDDAAVRDYAEAPLPADVRGAADAKVAAKLTPNLADARSQTNEAVSTRDSESKQEIDTAQQAAAAMNAETDAAQRKLVVDNRGKVAKLQGEGIGEAYDNVNTFTKDAADEQTARHKDIGDHVKTEESKAKDTLDKSETDAEKEKAEGERKAAEKKRKLEEEQNKGSWWDRVKNAIKKAVKFITDAIDAVFTAVRSAIKSIIEKAKNVAIGLINDARNWVKKKLNDFRDWAKSKVDKYLKDTFPGLAKRINDGIDSITDAAIRGVDAVADAAIEGVTKLADGLAAALDKILSTFQIALKTAVRVVGAVLQGDFAEALRAAIEGACEIAGVDPKTVFDFLDRAGKAIMSILKDPVKFIKGLFGAVGDGIANFFKNIKKHLIEGVIGWLTGALSEVNLTGPFEFSAKGILRIVLEILGLTYANIKSRVIKKLPAAAKVFDVVESGFALLKKLVTEGPGALWEEIKSQLSNLKETVMGAIRSWLITTVIKEGIVWLLSLTNPASAIVKAIKLLFDLVMFLVERYQQIKDFILSVYEAVAAVAAGNFTKVTKAVEDALVRVVPVLISLLASILGLGGIAKQVKKVIETITKPINKAIDFVIDKIVAFAKTVLGKIKAGATKVKEKAKEAVRKLLEWWKEKRSFKSKDGKSHEIYFKGTGKQAVMMVASESPDRIENFLTKTSESSDPDSGKAREALGKYKDVVKAENAISAAETKRSGISKAKNKEAWYAADGEFDAAVRTFRSELDALSKILQQVDFGAQDDALVQTNITFSSPGGRKVAMARPLTFLSGNTKGSGASADPPGWPHAVNLNKAKGEKRGGDWIRGHLISDGLHGPGDNVANVVTMRRTMNANMEEQVESDAKKAIKERGALFTYTTVAEFFPDNGPVVQFPKKIAVTWGAVTREPGPSPAKYKNKSGLKTVPFVEHVAPETEAETHVVNINTDGRKEIVRVLKEFTSLGADWFVQTTLLPGKPYKSLADINALKLGTSATSPNRDALVDAVIAAINAKKLKY